MAEFHDRRQPPATLAEAKEKFPSDFQRLKDTGHSLPKNFHNDEHGMFVAKNRLTGYHNVFTTTPHGVELFSPMTTRKDALHEARHGAGRTMGGVPVTYLSNPKPMDR